MTILDSAILESTISDFIILDLAILNLAILEQIQYKPLAQSWDFAGLQAGAAG